MSRPLVKNRDAALYLGAAAWLAGTVLLIDAWRGRGKDAPWIMSLLGPF